MSKLLRLLASVVVISGCASTAGERPATGEDEIRKLKADEIVGFMQYGDEVVASYTASPTYRAYGFRANAFDDVVVSLTSETPDTAIWATVVDDQGAEVLADQGPRAEAPSVELRVKRSDSATQRMIVFRETGGRPASVRIKLESTGVREPAAFFRGEPGTYAPPASFVNRDVDVPMRCRSRLFYMGGGASEKDATALVSLRFEPSAVQVLGADGVATALEETHLRASSPELANAVSLAQDAGSRTFLLQVTNVSPNEVRVEYASVKFASFTSVADRKPKTQLSCVGIARP